jgi:hypothetical protein
MIEIVQQAVPDVALYCGLRMKVLNLQDIFKETEFSQKKIYHHEYYFHQLEISTFKEISLFCKSNFS